MAMTREWPGELERAALHGTAGRFIEVVAPHTEADPAGLLVQFLTAFGNMVGPGPYFEVEGTRHSLNLFACLVGRTSVGRKGTSWGRVISVARRADPGWARERITGGLSSGEGLIAAIVEPAAKNVRRDPMSASTPDRAVCTSYAAEKRLLVVEPEFASTLRVMARDGNTLSPIIRQAWDSGDLAVLTRNNPLTAQGAHISIIGHITLDELQHDLDRLEQINGFANRFFWVLVRRAQVLPEGGNLKAADLDPVSKEVSDALCLCRAAGEVKLTRDAEATRLWYEVYEGLTESRLGIYGAATARGAPLVMRLASIYALLDRSQYIRRPHLEAALAVWRYSEASVRYIFGEASGYPLADELLRLLRTREEGVTRTEIGEHFGRNRRSDEITRALNYLAEHGLARSLREEAGRGRPPERWSAITQ